MKTPDLRLGINIDHVATIRNARDRSTLAHPDLVRAATAAIKGGADSITFHLREDRRHIIDEDLERLCREIKAPLNLEMAATKEMRHIALAAKPFAICLVPEKRHEVTTEGGLDVHAGDNQLKPFVHDLRNAGMRVSMFVNADPRQIEASARVGASAVELHVGRYAESRHEAREQELAALKTAAEQAHALGLEVHAGHGLNYENTPAIAAIPQITELNIGHFLVGEAVFIGFDQAVHQMKQIMLRARR